MNKTLHKQLVLAKAATYELVQLSTSKKNTVLRDVARALVVHTNSILRANAKDCANVPRNYPMMDRLQLTRERIADMANGITAVAKLSDPIGTEMSQRKRPSGITVRQVRVPIGVIGVIYEARPNVTADIFSLAFKTGNVVVLKGGSDAKYSNQAIVNCIQSVLRAHGITRDALQMIDPMKRELTTQLLQADGLVDIAIPRGSNALIQFVRTTATVPVIETGAGVCHTYVEQSANIDAAIPVIVNAKVRRCTVCNALDCLVIDESMLKKLLPKLAVELQNYNVALYADSKSYSVLRAVYPAALLHRARPSDFGKEFLAMKMAIKTVKNFHEGLRFVQTNTSGHSEAILTTKARYAEQFQQLVDAAAVYVNTSTAFTDGFEFGLGAEVGISTQKLHARGPMGLQELTTYKWLVSSASKTRRS